VGRSAVALSRFVRSDSSHLERRDRLVRHDETTAIVCSPTERRTLSFGRHRARYPVLAMLVEEDVRSWDRFIPDP
jgi:hypothetical protein